MNRLIEVRDKAITPALALLPDAMSRNRPRVDIQLLTTHLQEAPNGEQCQVTSNKSVCGPARGIWQFEKGGGVRGVLTHPSSKAAAVAACKALGIKPTEDGVFAALPGNVDVIDAVFARLLYWTDSKPLPVLGDVDAAWQYYLLNWRPGAYARGTAEQREALRHKWGMNYRRALDVVIP